ncbi:MAG: hypothetical protein Ct9H90mP13_04140 [Pseudomonadota bacterium]|nr:MAG: hypothetical protein Ct9H90mP13_04140 [Pseudomonadota bacterium]
MMILEKRFLKESNKCKAKCRYRQADAKCEIQLHKDGIRVVFDEDQGAHNSWSISCHLFE